MRRRLVSVESRLSLIQRLVVRLIVVFVVDASNADWNFGNNIDAASSAAGAAAAASREACERRGGVWTRRRADGDRSADETPFGVEALIVVACLISALFGLACPIAWSTLRRKSASMYVRYKTDQSDKAYLLPSSSVSSSPLRSSIFLRLLRFFRPPSMRRGVAFALSLSALTLLFTTYYVSTFHSRRDFRWRALAPPDPEFVCKMAPFKSKSNSSLRDSSFSGPPLVEPKVLLLVETPYSTNGVQIAQILDANRIRFRVEPLRNTLPALTTGNGSGRYAVIVFENLLSYMRLNQWNRDLLDSYCQHYKAGMIYFSKPADETETDRPLKGIPNLVYSTNLALKDLQLFPSAPLFRILRPGRVLTGPTPKRDWTSFHADGDEAFVPVALAFRADKQSAATNSSLESLVEDRVALVTVMQDTGANDGIRRVFFGHEISSVWLHKVLFLEALDHLSNGRISISLDRFVQIDIDDILVGRVRMIESDVDALLDAQRDFADVIPGFKFLLGYSGNFYHRGQSDEDEAEDYLISRAKEFLWFGHMWRHTQPHKLDSAQMLQEMQWNREFGLQRGIPLDETVYSVAPHHSGVYPVHDALYQAWKKVWGVRVTSTEEYPHLRPPHKRRGFVHRDIFVLPRQTCGLYTHNLYLDEYPGGKKALFRSIEGGELFQTLLFNPVNIFMTHMSNYARDRLALLTFRSLFDFVSCWTNLRIKSAPPFELAMKYFELFPGEQSPLWGDPCSDPRHREIWSAEKTCGRLPDFIIVGPQKTGTTALHWFLTLHPRISASIKSSETYEEVQFFNGNNYFRGVDWYMTFFPDRNQTQGKLIFEKSANYFDQELVPQRVRALLPKTRVIVIIISAAKRAYSWYQHSRAKREPVALAHSFHDIVTGSVAPHLSPSHVRQLRSLRNHCLQPGYYAQHLERWLSHVPPRQLLVVDGEELKSRPYGVLDRVQDFLDVEKVNYEELIKFDPKKGFFCQIKDERRTLCLGKGKGRRYPPMDLLTQNYLQRHFEPHNLALVKLLKKLGLKIPNWLEEDLTKVSEV